jgi:protein-disulfide isomerase/uncharacterized membrane protein
MRPRCASRNSVARVPYPAVNSEAPVAETPSFEQPKPWIRWLAVALALAGWWVSWKLLLVSFGAAANDPFLQVVCGGGPSSGCDSVLTSSHAYVRISPSGEAPKIPVSAFGMGYFAFVALWYLFVGPPVWRSRLWHLLPGLVVLFGAAESLAYIGVMKYVLGRWCGGCLAAHAINGGLLLLTLAAYPWRRTTPPGPRHPSTRLALATVAAGGLAFLLHLVGTYTATVLNILQERTGTYAEVLNDPEFILWDFNRQPVVSIPLYEDELIAGAPSAPNTVVVFSDFQCPACLKSHEMLLRVAEKYPTAVRVVFRYYPQDPACNANPRFRSGGHASACRAAQAAEAARVVGGRDAYLAMRKKLWDNQAALPMRPYVDQNARARELFADWAADLGLGRAAFVAAMDSPAVAARIQADIAEADRLGIQTVPVVYVNGKRLRNWSKLETWDAILGGQPPAGTQSSTIPLDSAGPTSSRS